MKEEIALEDSSILFSGKNMIGPTIKAIEKTADELFEELGYKKYDNHPEEDFPSEPNTFSTQDVRRLYYEQKGTLRIGVEGLEHIEFDLIKKNVVCWARINGRFTIVPLSIKELQAISKKCQELRWVK